MGGTSRGRSPRSKVGVALAVAALVAALALPVGAVAAPPEAAGPPVRAIVLFDRAPGAAEQAAVQALGGDVRHTYTLIDGMAVEIPAQAIPALRRNPRVASVELDATITTLEPVVQAESTGEYEYDNAWGVVRIGAKSVHDAGIWGQGVKVAVIDTGIDYVHDQPPELEPPVVDPEFLGNYAGGYDFVNGDANPMDDNGHGTHVAGILAAERNWYLVVGVAPQVDLYALKVLAADGSGYESDLILALQWAVDHDIDVVNMSLGTHENVPALQAAVENAAAAGLLMVAASGNTVTFQEILYGCAVTYPGAYPQVLATTFTNANDALTGYSCTGPEVDFASPGDNIFSPVPVGSCQSCSPNGYLPLSGTSMASPHLAGTVALLLSAGLADAGTPGRFDDVRNRLCATADVAYGVQTVFGTSTPIPPGDPRYPSYFGCGVVDAAEAVLGVTPPPNRPPVAGDDTATTSEDTAVDVAVLDDDTDPDGDTVAVTAVADPPHGSASVTADGQVRYVPDANWHGTDAFGYTISDGRGGSSGATVTVEVVPVNDPPVAANDGASTTQGAPVTVAVLANDTDVDGGSLAIASVSDPPHGTAAPNADGTITYTPDAGYSGADAFGYAATDGLATSNVATVSVTIAPSPPPPSPTLHVGDLDRATSTSGKSWTAKVTIRIHDAAHAGVSGVVVTGTWSAGASGTSSCTTGTNGACTVQKTKLARSSVASVTFSVTAATRSGWTYTPAANHDPDSDSTGTVIVVARPS
jgi:subtilisin family serine protease